MSREKEEERGRERRKGGDGEEGLGSEGESVVPLAPLEKCHLSL